MIRLVRWVARFLGAPASRWADFRNALDAYALGDYHTALRVFMPMAEAGYVAAQTNMALMYRKGQGVPRDYAEAFKWYLRAAKQGDAYAQLSTGFMYEEGEGVPQDNTQAYKWFTLSYEGRLSGWREGVIARDRVAGKMSVAKIDAAEQLVRDFVPKMERFI